MGPGLFTCLYHRIVFPLTVLWMVGEGPSRARLRVLMSDITKASLHHVNKVSLTT